VWCTIVERSATPDATVIAAPCAQIAVTFGTTCGGLDKTTTRSSGTGSTAGVTGETCAPTSATAVMM